MAEVFQHSRITFGRWIALIFLTVLSHGKVFRIRALFNHQEINRLLVKKVVGETKTKIDGGLWTWYGRAWSRGSIYFCCRCGHCGNRRKGSISFRWNAKTYSIWATSLASAFPLLMVSKLCRNWDPWTTGTCWTFTPSILSKRSRFLPMWM